MDETPLYIAVIGPESTGKSTLAKALARHFAARLVEEYAREYLETRDGRYESADLDRIADGQDEQMDAAQDELNIFDTDLLSLYLWKRDKFQLDDQNLLQRWAARGIDLFLLCKDDVPWIRNSLRECKYKRGVLFRQHLELLEMHSKRFVVIAGTYAERTEQAKKVLRDFLAGVRA